MKRRVFIGFDPREAAAFAVARFSLMRHMNPILPINGLVLDKLRYMGLYWRPTEMRDGPTGRPIMWDVISDAPMSTEHANARFLVKEIARTGWALFMDGDILVRENINALFDMLDPKKAVYCVWHDQPEGEAVKMDGQAQVPYARKNQSSVMAINCQHPANEALTVEMINTLPGRDLHKFCWLRDEHIGRLPREWNYLIGASEPLFSPSVCHFTLGVPDMPGYETCEYAEAWRKELRLWAG